jgi:FtsZ-binding cell division protein ZapB
MESKRTPIEEMRTALDEFDAGRSTFRQLLDRLEKSVDEFGDADASWQEAFRRQWGRMEDTYAYAAFKGWKTIPEGDMSETASALAEVRRMVTEKASPPR